MNNFKSSEKPSHKYYSTNPQPKDFITDREFAQDHSLNSSDLNLSFNSLHGSFFSESSNRACDDYLSSPILQPAIIKRSKEEETNYTSKASPVILEKEEFKKSWLCQNCDDLNPCNSFCLIY